MAVHYFGLRPPPTTKAICLLAGEKVGENGPSTGVVLKHGSLLDKLTAQQVQFTQFDRR